MSWIDTIKGLAPTVASALLGPLGGVAVAAIGNILGMSDPTTETIAKVFADGQLTPDNLTKIRALEIEFKTHESDMGYKYAELEFKKDEMVAKDRADSRAMQIATHSRMPATLTIMVTIGFFSVLGAMIAIPDLKANDVVLLMVGQLATVWSACVAFYVSTTYSSANKNLMLAQSTPAAK